MLKVEIPGHGLLCLRCLVSDYNGTLACDGTLIPDIIPLLHALSEHLAIHVVTADTFGFARDQLAGLPVTLTILPPEQQDQGKLDYVKQLGTKSAICLGNGKNDMLMLREAALGICLIEHEGACVQTLLEADIVCKTVSDALNLLLNPKRLTATLRI